jgi:hypothetical protein
MRLYDESNRLDRIAALRLYTEGSAWFSGDADRKGAIAVGQLADLALLSLDYFTVPEEEIRGIESLLTVVDGKVVHAAGEFGGLAPPPLPVSPDWSPTGRYGGYYRGSRAAAAHADGYASAPHRHAKIRLPYEDRFRNPGCDCFAY